MSDQVALLFGDRLSTLEPDVLTLVSYAALLGYRFEAPLATACAGLPETRGNAALRRCCELGLTVRESRSPADYRFRHALVQAAVRDYLDAAGLRALHARIAAVVESLPDAGSRVEQLAHHWSAAGDAAKAIHYCERAARNALRLGAERDAAAWRARVS